MEVNIINSLKNQPRLLYELEEAIACDINSIPDDVEKVFEFARLRGEQNPFVIINKAKSQAGVYRNGEKIDNFEIGVGKAVGDDLNTSIYVNGDFTKEGGTTPSGQFYTDQPDFLSDIQGYENGTVINLIALRGVQHPINYKQRAQLALHQVSKFKPERLEMFKKTGKRRSMTSGCIDFMPNDFYRFANEINPKGTAVYILPEDKGNKLELVALPQGLWFKTKYADVEKENTFVAAMRKFFRLD